MESVDFSILNLSTEERDPEEIAPFFQDLNLFQIIDRLSRGYGKKVVDYYRYLAKDRGEEAYRRAIYQDIKKEAVYNAFMKYRSDLAIVEDLRNEKSKVSIPSQYAVWHLREVEAYCQTYEDLASELDKAGLSSEGMNRFLTILKDILESGGYREIRQETAKLLEEMHRLRFILTYDKDRISVELGEVPGDGAYEEMLKKEAGKEARRLENPFRAIPSLTELEYYCIEILRKKNPDFFRESERVAKASKGYEKPVLKRFEQEILFYLSYATLQREMEGEGFSFATPETDDEECMKGEGLFDLALALANQSTGKKVVPNDFYYEKGDRFFVLTGPNQGGKTTFARSLGQLVYFTRLGLDVPARSANVPFYSDIQTHFSVEESVETGRGKLKEELTRLAPMMEGNKKGTFVIINELFTTAASYDAEIMGKKVLKHFVDLGCTGIYVTHLRELSSGIEGVVSLRAMLNDQRVQTFEIKRGEALDIPCAENQVNKYRLTYEQLKERL